MSSAPEQPTPSFDQHQLKGITIKNMITTIISTASVVFCVLTTYYELSGKIDKNAERQESQNRVTDIRLKTLEGHVELLQHEIDMVKEERATRPDRPASM